MTRCSFSGRPWASSTTSLRTKVGLTTSSSCLCYWSHRSKLPNFKPRSNALPDALDPMDVCSNSRNYSDPLISTPLHCSAHKTPGFLTEATSKANVFPQSGPCSGRKTIRNGQPTEEAAASHRRLAHRGRSRCCRVNYKARAITSNHRRAKPANHLPLAYFGLGNIQAARRLDQINSLASRAIRRHCARILKEAT
jgi:hypothetical protein